MSAAGSAARQKAPGVRARVQAFRVYAPGELGSDGYPPEWHKLPSAHGTWPGLKHIVREQAGHRCVRCLHPYHNGEHGSGEWTPCSKSCQHAGPYRIWIDGAWKDGAFDVEGLKAPRLFVIGGTPVEARWRILTVHHLDGDKANCRWWNLAALCQRCHLSIQGRVRMAQVYPHEHSEWFKPYAAGYYASVYLSADLTREQTLARMDELLALELHARPDRSLVGRADKPGGGPA